MGSNCVHSRPLSIVAVIWFCAGMLGCRVFNPIKKEQNTTASIDALVKNNINERATYPCGPNAQLESNAIDAFNSTYEAAPELLRMIFPRNAFVLHVASGGDESVPAGVKSATDDIRETCKAAGERNEQYVQLEAVKNQLGNLAACAIAEKSADGAETRIVVHMLKDARVIYTNMIRTMAWSLSASVDMMLASADKAKDAKTELVAFLKGFKEERRKLVHGVLIDFRNMGRTMDQVRAFAAPYRLKASLKLVSSDDNDLFAIVDSAPLMSHFVFAELTDSFYCSAESVEEFFKPEAKFTTSACRYQVFAERLGRQSFNKDGGQKYCPDEPKQPVTTPIPHATQPPGGGTPSPASMVR